MQKIDYKSYRKPSDFLKLEPGENIVRIVSSGGIATIYGMKTSGRWIRFGESVPEEVKNKYGESLSAARKWIWIAINRTTQQVGMLEVGAMIGDKICELAKQKGADPQEFDVIITRTGEGTKTRYVTELAGPVVLLTTAEQAKIKKDKEYLIKKYYANINTSNS